MQKVPTKCHVNRALEPRIITVDTQNASGHLVIFPFYIHIETDSRSFKVPAILLGTLYGDVLPIVGKTWWCFTYDLCQLSLIFEEAKVLKRIFFFNLQRSKVLQKAWDFDDLYIDGWTLNII